MVSSLGGSGITCQKLTADSFKAYGNVIQTYGSAENAPQGVASQVSPDGKTIKFHELSPVKNSYAAETGATTGISVFRCTVKDGMEKAKPWPVHLMERHPSTEQAFIPMGIAEVGLRLQFVLALCWSDRNLLLMRQWTGKAEEPLDGGAAYVIIVADGGSGLSMQAHLMTSAELMIDSFR
jgi:ureidoglycolate hydrolase